MWPLNRFNHIYRLEHSILQAETWKSKTKFPAPESTSFPFDLLTQRCCPSGHGCVENDSSVFVQIKVIMIPVWHVRVNNQTASFTSRPYIIISISPPGRNNQIAQIHATTRMQSDLSGGITRGAVWPLSPLSQCLLFLTPKTMVFISNHGRAWCRGAHIKTLSYWQLHPRSAGPPSCRQCCRRLSLLLMQHAV